MTTAYEDLIAQLPPEDRAARELSEEAWKWAWLAPPVGFVLGIIMACNTGREGSVKRGANVMATSLIVVPLIWAALAYGLHIFHVV